MMFHKQYYRLEEAAQKLGVDVETLIQNYRDLSICTKIQETIFFDTLESRVIRIEEIIRHAGDADIIKRIESLGGIYCRVLGFDEVEGGIWVRIVSSSIEFTPFEKVNALILCDDYFCKRNELLITHTELTRLLALKAERDGKPTAEQLQQQLDEANARIAELEAKPSTDNSEPAAKSKTSINAFLSALNKAYPNLDIARIIEQSDGNISDKTIYKYLKDGI